MQTIQHAVKQYYAYIQVEQYLLGLMVVVSVTVSLCNTF